MPTESTLLRVLLRQRHMQGYMTFRKEYDRVAKQLDGDLVGQWPSKAQFYRWMSGDLLGLPYADHCRVLEKMFPGWTAQQLLAPHEGDGESLVTPPQRTASNAPAPRPVQLPQQARLADVTAVYATRTELLHNVTPRALFDGVKQISMAGLSLNMLCQQYSDKSLLDAIEEGTVIRALFLDPNGTHTAARESEEGLPAGHLSTLTRLNIEALSRLGAKVSPSAKGSLGIRVYDEPIRYNITIVDQFKCVVQPYLPDARGVESPTLVIEKDETMPGLYTTFAQVFESMWDRAREVA
ncbi:DUF5919 domain-containing protein [Lentzea flava]|uniref:DUF5919 domain-containing protein n=1 Tax=Lentzea flava TaxID=103732 RepID=A0ABQ2UE46_9PSEU|nr:DUF5919 domain-containing protein [Lentzea flava]MCP2198501.1 hypothetical protein [Lentzea flava]GGU26308.1 hypothetical protein GCM10010178_18310 [Lentzea flava]